MTYFKLKWLGMSAGAVAITVGAFALSPSATAHACIDSESETYTLELVEVTEDGVPVDDASSWDGWVPYLNANYDGVRVGATGDGKRYTESFVGPR